MIGTPQFTTLGQWPVENVCERPGEHPLVAVRVYASREQPFEWDYDGHSYTSTHAETAIWTVLMGPVELINQPQSIKDMLLEDRCAFG